MLVAEIDETAGADTARWLRETWGVRARFVHTDVTQQSQVKAMVDTAVAEFGRLDILVNNAWRGQGYARLEKTSPENMSAGFDMAVLAAFWAMQRAYPALVAHGTGRIVNLASLNGVNAHMYSVAYNAAKEALRALTRTAAREWAPKQVCCNVICPCAQSAAYQRVPGARRPRLARSWRRSRRPVALPVHRIGEQFRHLLERAAVDQVGVGIDQIPNRFGRGEPRDGTCDVRRPVDRAGVSVFSGGHSMIGLSRVRLCDKISRTVPVRGATDDRDRPAPDTVR